jgi:predicted HTH transcriptional regulator
MAMNLNTILADLKAQRDKLDEAISALGGVSPKRYRARRGRISAAGRKRLSELMKRRWAKRKKKTKRA